MRFAALVLAFAAVAAAKGAKPKELSQSEFVELGAETLATAKAKHRAFLNTVLKLKGDWWEEYSKDAPPEYLQAPWASAPSMKTVKLPEAPKPMPPPPAPEQGFQGSGKFYPPPPAPPPSPPPPLPPPPPAPATTFAAAQAPSSSTPIVQSHAASPQASGFKDTGASLHPTAKPGEARFTQASASLVANDAASADAVTAPATADKGKTAAPARLRRRLRRGRRTRNDAPDLDAVSSAMFAEADAAGTDASPSESVASAMELLEVASSVGEHAGGRDTSKDGAAAQAGVGGEGERNFQWQYYDPNNPPPWLLPSWNSAPRSHTPPPMLPNLNPASPYPYPGNTQPYSDGYPVGFLEIDALLAKHDRAHPKFEAPERRKPE